MAKLSELGIGNEQITNVDFAEMPDQMGSFTDPPQPGTFRFRLPQKLDAIWDKVDAEVGPRIKAQFDSSAPLTIVQSKDKKYDGDPFETTITNVERKRGRRDDPTAGTASDMDFLLRDAFGLQKRPQTNAQYAQALMAQAGKEFTARVTWSWRCRKDKPIRVDNGQGGLTEVPDQLGCDTRYYQRDVPMEPENPDDPNSPKIYPLRIVCQCGASLRAYPNLEGFAP